MPFLKKKKSILLLDDDPSMQRLVKTILTREGFRIESFLTGRQAIAAIDAGGSYDALLLDLMMPHEGGMTVIRHLRTKNPALLRHVLLLTASPDSIIATVEPEIAGVVPKPFTKEDLVRAVRAVSGQG